MTVSPRICLRNNFSLLQNEIKRYRAYKKNATFSILWRDPLTLTKISKELIQGQVLLKRGLRGNNSSNSRLIFKENKFSNNNRNNRIAEKHPNCHQKQATDFSEKVSFFEILLTLNMFLYQSELKQKHQPSHLFAT